MNNTATARESLRVGDALAQEALDDYLLSAPLTICRDRGKQTQRYYSAGDGSLLLGEEPEPEPEIVIETQSYEVPMSQRDSQRVPATHGESK